MFTRRRFVQGLSGGALLLAQGRGRALAAGNAPAELTGPDFHLSIDELPVNYTGAAVAHAPGRHRHHPRY